MMVLLQWSARLVPSKICFAHYFKTVLLAGSIESYLHVMSFPKHGQLPDEDK